MEFSVDRRAFLRELNLIQGVVERKTTIPVLQNVVVRAEKGDLSLTATDLDVTLECRCEGEVGRCGARVVNAKKLFEVVKALSEPTVRFSGDGQGRLKVACGVSVFHLAGWALGDFPKVPGLLEAETSVSANLMRQMIGSTAYAITQEESRYALSGALFVVEGARLSMVATDGHRLAMAHCDLDRAGRSLRVLVPKKALAELAKMVALESEGRCALAFAEGEGKQVYFQVGNRRLWSRPVTGEFPNYEVVVPRENKMAVECPAAALAVSVKRAALTAEEGTNAVTFDLGEAGLRITSSHPDQGEAEEFVPVEYAGPGVKLRFNAASLNDFLVAASGAEKVRLEIKDFQTPVILKPVGATEIEYSCVIMPLRLAVEVAAAA